MASTCLPDFFARIDSELIAMRRENEKCLLAKRVIPSNISFMKLLDMMVVNSYSYSGPSGSKNVSVTATDSVRITMIDVTGMFSLLKG